MTQVNAYITPEEKRRFEDYADQLCIDASSFLKLLIARELRRKRLSRPNQTNPHSKNKVTAHFSDKSKAQINTYNAFASYTQELGITKARAASALISIELSESWLDHALSSI